MRVNSIVHTRPNTSPCNEATDIGHTTHCRDESFVHTPPCSRASADRMSHHHTYYVTSSYILCHTPPCSRASASACLCSKPSASVVKPVPLHVAILYLRRVGEPPLDLIQILHSILLLEPPPLQSPGTAGNRRRRGRYLCLLRLLCAFVCV